ncbi:hypothetical protein V498_05779 [Pseudogymnoascus sp. VKM F-4517 (FW-2822)]|nr:hypothetical protein V498_05779 [Pseudogymnoascus sp. VKM F-4517 (FW-2822)]
MWDEYLTQAVFATRLRIHAVSQYSPFYLLYGVTPKLPGDPYEAHNGTEEERIQRTIDRHAQSNEARVEANRKLVEAAIRASLVRDEQYAPKPGIKVGTYVLVRDENPRKFRPKWYGPYKVLMAAPIGTYALEDCHNKVVKSLIHERSFEVKELLEQEGVLGYSYKELAMITKREWLNLQSRGLDSSKLGEGKVGDISYEEAIFKKLKARVLALERRVEKDAQAEERDDTTTPLQIPSETIVRSVDTQLQGPTVIPQSNTQLQADVSPNERPPRAPSNEPAIVTSERTVQKSQEMRTPAQERLVAVTTTPYTDRESRDLQPLSQDSPNEEPGIAIQYSDGSPSSVMINTEEGSTIERQRVDSTPPKNSKERSRTDISRTKQCRTKVSRNTRTNYSLRKAPRKKVLK